MISYPQIKIAEIADVKGGKRLPKGHEFVLAETKHPYIRARDIKDGKVTFDDPVYLTEDTHDKIKRYIANKGNVCITIVGANVGDVGIVPQKLDGANLTENAVKLIGKTDDYVAKYVLFALLGDDPQRQMKNFAAGAAQPKLGIYKINEIQIPYPPKAEREKIASILSAYDDLIENNTRRIKILEEMAQTIYREWFVNFRFPGHEKYPRPLGEGKGEGPYRLVDSSLGKIPEGWEVVKFADVAEVNARSIRKGNTPGNINYIDISSVSTGSVDKVEDVAFSEAPSRARRIVQHGDVIWATVRPNRKSYSLILKPIDDLIVSTGFAVLSPTKVPFAYLYQTVTTEDFVAYLVNNATGSAYPAVNAGAFKNSDMLLPSREILALFHESTEGHFLLKHNLELKNKNLRQTRDLLLPKLISGAIDVSKMEIETKEAAA